MAQPPLNLRQANAQALRNRVKSVNRVLHSPRIGSRNSLASPTVFRLARVYDEHYPRNEKFLAFTHMPPASGVALGFDRLVMLATGTRVIEDVLWITAP